MNIGQHANRSAAGFKLDQSQPAGGTETISADSAPLVFVTGASRSGTTMLARMLGAHSEVMTFNELHYFGSIWDPTDHERQFSGRELSEIAALLLARQTNGLWGGRPSDVERAWGRRLVRELSTEQCTAAGLYAAVLKQLSQDAGKSFACEQTPRNIFYARRLLDIYPNAHVVHIVRDPRAVLASQKNRWKLRRLGADHLPVSEMLRNRVNYHPVTMGQLWMKSTEEASRLLDHPRFMLVRFEDLVADPKASSRRICGSLGLNYESGMLNIPRWGSSNVEHTMENTGVSAEVTDQWRHKLSIGEALLCEKITHPMMQRFGYPLEFLSSTRSLAILPSLLTYPLHVAGVVALNPGRALIQLRALRRAQA